MKKKKNIIIGIVSLCLFIFIFTYEKIEGIYGSDIFRTLRTGYNGYIVFQEGEVYSIDEAPEKLDPRDKRTNRYRIEKLGIYFPDENGYTLELDKYDLGVSQASANFLKLKWSYYEVLLDGEPLQDEDLLRVFSPIKKRELQTALQNYKDNQNN